MNAKKLSIMHSAYFWIILSLLAFALLPSNALDYGLFESTSDEYLEAMGWASFNLTWAWFLPVIVYGALPLFEIATANPSKNRAIFDRTFCTVYVYQCDGVQN
ncbi:ferric transport system permease protein FbpB [Haemophilus influenzae]|uniref:Ferric transport system permease protein FbpB n=1 Tax=Haemophilus influenzae TaxID=727 RepID=A0A2X1PVQ0_HAEIF|nr:ferric transport system permease protein FbpB [Haemophilus influenzae]